MTELGAELLPHVFYKQEGRRDNLTGQSMEPGLPSTVKHHGNRDAMDSLDQKAKWVTQSGPKSIPYYFKEESIQ